MKVLKVETENNNSHSVQIQDGEIKVWIDVWRDNDNDDFSTEWNMYIFDLTNDNDLAIRAYQENCDNYINCTELAEERILNLLN
jgi:hypothetical protein